MTDLAKLSPPDFSAALRRELARGLPGRGAHRTMAPELAYGRHAGPVPCAARKAAVLLALNFHQGRWSIPAIVRPATMKAHAGQVALPGGLVEPGESPADTAQREFEEELGPQTSGFDVVGQLSPVYVFISRFEVTPVLAVSSRPLTLLPSPDEVEQVVHLSLEHMLDRACRGNHLICRGQLTFRAPHFRLSECQVWGATSLILAEFATLVARIAAT